jgi:drug/metabolite transporter (DMT)-like permease
LKRTYVAFILQGIFGGANFIYTKWAAELVTPGQISLLRVFFGFLPLVCMALSNRSLKLAQARHLHHFVVMAALATAFTYFAMAKGTTLLPSGIAGVLGGSSPLFTVLASGLFLRNEKMNRMMVCSVVTGLSGMVLIARPWMSLGNGDAINLAGVAWILAGAMVYGLSYIYVRLFLSPLDIEPLAIVTWQTGLAFLILLLFTDMSGISHILLDWRATAGLAIGLGLLGTGASFVLFYILLRELGAVAATGWIYMTPVVALCIGWMAGEQVGLLEILAVIVIFGSIAMLEFGRQQITNNGEKKARAA